MTKQIILSIQQRERGLLSLIEDAHDLGFNEVLIEDYKRQLGQVQKVVKADKEKLKLRRIEWAK